MDKVSIAVSFIVAIFGIAYPVIFQVISRLDEKYNSELILELFNNGKEGKAFKWILGLSVFSIILYMLNLHPLRDFGILNPLINNSALLLLLTSTLLLIITFFFLVEKVLVYYTPSKLFTYLSKKHKKSSDNSNTYLLAVTDVLLKSVQESNEKLIISAYSFFDEEYQNVEIDKKTGKDLYRDVDFKIFYRLLEALMNQQNLHLSYLKSWAVNKRWIINATDYHLVSDQSKQWFWEYLLLAVKSNDDDLVLTFWENSASYFTSYLKRVEKEFEGDNFEITNQADIVKRDNEREEYLDMFYALGGLLLYKERYSCINRIFRYTTSIPPEYVLLPISMGDVLKRFITFRDPLERKFTFINHTYRFPETEGLNSGSLIKIWITRYIALLLIRQYSIQPYFINMNPLELPKPPKEQLDKRLLMDNIEFLEKQVQKILINKPLLTVTKLDFITTEWLKEQSKPHPIELIVSYKMLLEKEFEETQINQEISKNKKEIFDSTSARIINDAIGRYIPVITRGEILKDYQSRFLYGERSLVRKDPFTDNTDASYMNYESFLAEDVALQLRNLLPQVFIELKTREFLLTITGIFTAIDNLKLSQEFTIICFGIDINWLTTQLKTGTIAQNSYNGIPLFCYPGSYNSEVQQSVFVIKKTDQPTIEFHEVEKDIREKYALERIEKNINLYSSILPLNENISLRNELEIRNKDKDLNKFVLLSLTMNLEIGWKKDAKCLMVKVYSKYRESGIPNKIDEVMRADTLN